MKKINFRAINQHALPHIDKVIRQWLPDGTRKGSEWVALNPTRSDSMAGSFSVNLNSGIWKDFATDDGGADLISLVAYIERTGQKEAAKELEAFLGMTNRMPSSRLSTPKTSKQSNFTPVYPPPIEAGRSCPLEHPEKGTPTHYWDYISPEGNLLMRVMRFDEDANGQVKKEFRPLCYGKLGGQAPKWRWRQLPQDRPIYRLEHFKSQRTTVICEGEKAADAAAQLFPTFFVTTWSGGAKAIGKTNFSPLAGQHIIIWPDNDSAGQQTVSLLTKKLQGVGVSAIDVIDLTFFTDFSPLEAGELAVGGKWPDKADAYDALELGWQTEHMKDAINRGVLFLDSGRTGITGSSEKLPYGYTLNSDGLFFNDGYSDKKICDPIEIIARSKSASGDGRNWGVLVRFKDFDGQEKQWNIPMQAFATDGGNEIVRGLLERGLQIKPSREAKLKLLAYLQEYQTSRRVSLVYRTGWYQGTFVLPDSIVGENKSLLYYSERPVLCKLHSKGSLDDWKINVSKYCSDNPLAIFAISSAFSGPLLTLMNMEPMGFHLYGDSSWGKSTLLNLACSVYGPPGEYKSTFRTTDNALEGLATSHSDMFLAIDEIHQVNPRSVSEMIYMLGNGQGKHRANDRGQTKDLENKWKLTYMTSGEKQLAQYLGDGGKKITGGMEMRFLGIYATQQQNEEDKKHMGVFNTAHGMAGGAELSLFLTRQMSTYYGTAFPEYINRIVSFNENGLIPFLDEGIELFLKENCTNDAGGQVQRAAVKFALVGLAGELATRFGLTGWQPNEAIESARICFTDWVSRRGGQGNMEDRQILHDLRLQLQLHGESNFKRWDKNPNELSDRQSTIIDSHVHSPALMWGYRQPINLKCDEDGEAQDNIFYIFPAAFESEVCKGHDPVRVARILRERGILELRESELKENRFKTKERVPGSGKKYIPIYKIKGSSLFDESL